MGDLEHVVYQDHTVAGAPQVGDVVAVVWDGNPTDLADKDQQCHRGYIGRLYSVWSSTTPVVYPWRVDGLALVHAVRRPTEAELAAWALTQDPGHPAC